MYPLGTAGCEQMWKAKGREVGPSAEGVCRSSLDWPRCRGGVRVTCPRVGPWLLPLIGIRVVPGRLLHAFDSVSVVTSVVPLRKSCQVFAATRQHRTNTQSWSQRCPTSWLGLCGFLLKCLMARDIGDVKLSGDLPQMGTVVTLNDVAFAEQGPCAHSAFSEHSH